MQDQTDGRDSDSAAPDIKTIIETDVNTNWIYWALGGITLLALIGFIIFLYKTKFGKEEKPMRQKISYSQQRRQHHRAVVKKTA